MALNVITVVGLINFMSVDVTTDSPGHNADEEERKGGFTVPNLGPALKLLKPREGANIKFSRLREGGWAINRGELKAARVPRVRRS